MDFIPNTDSDRRLMLREIGLSDVEDLFSHIPAAVRLPGPLDLPPELSECALVEHMTKLSGKNADVQRYNSFLGAGSYQHYIPSIVEHLLSRSEFYSAYTPYQAEISQGTLEAIYEFQSLICLLTGMDVANASMYDASTALAEAAVVAATQTRNKRIVISQTVHPEYREVLHTYAAVQNLEVVEVKYTDGITDLADLEAKMGGKSSAVIFQQPNFFGCLEHTGDISSLVKSNKSLLITVADPVSLAILKAPAAYGADIVVGDAQPFGNPIAYGGPHVGYFAATKSLMRKMPGRIVGSTVDDKGNTGYVLTLQAREQHIRREKATSNICTNSALATLAATVAMAAMGKKGLQEIAVQCACKAKYAFERLTALKSVTSAFSRPFFREFAVSYSGDINKLNEDLLQQHILGGLPLERFYPELDNTALLAVTEVKSKQKIDRLISAWEGLQ